MKSDVRLVVRNRQSGVVLFVAMIALVAMTLAGIALVRSMDTGLVAAGNMAFKQATINVAERGTEQAIRWLQDNATAVIATSSSGERVLWFDSPTSGYYATYMDGCDLTGNRTETPDDAVNWKDAEHPSGIASTNCGMTGVEVAGMPSGYSASYVINRMSSSEGKVGSINAATGETVSGAVFTGALNQYGKSTKRAPESGLGPLAYSASSYYRITTRVVGPRSGVSYTQALVGL